LKFLAPKDSQSGKIKKLDEIQTILGKTVTGEVGWQNWGWATSNKPFGRGNLKH